MSRFIGDLVVRFISEDKEGRSIWELAQDFAFESTVAGMTIVAKKGTLTDFASIPRVPILYLAAGDRGHKAAVIHDYLYQEEPHSMNRLLADKVLREGLICEGFSPEEADVWYTAVRFGGSGHYDANLSVVAVAPPAPLLP